jgi:hypothetical protein
MAVHLNRLFQGQSICETWLNGGAHPVFYHSTPHDDASRTHLASLLGTFAIEQYFQAVGLWSEPGVEIVRFRADIVLGRKFQAEGLIPYADLVDDGKPKGGK